MSLPDKRRGHRLGSDLFTFVGLRLGSGVLSFLLFALLARWFAAEETKSLYYFLFLLGFFTSVLRALATIAAALRDGETRAAKMRRVGRAYGQVFAVSLLLLPLALWASTTLSGPLWVYAGIVALLLTWGVDIDILRAVVGRSSIIAAAGASGALLAVVCLVVFRSLDAALAAILLQWVPICALNAWVLARWRRHIIRSARATLVRFGAGMWGPLTVAVFDGIVLNTPFFLGDSTPPELGRSIGVVTRIFVSSVILMPLLVYWSNGNALGRIAVAAHLPVPVVYGGLAATTGLAAGAAFASAFAWIAGTPPTGAELAASALLLLGFSVYAAAGRYRGKLSPALVGILLALAAANAAAILAIISLQGQALAVTAVQAFFLLAAAGLMTLANR